MTDNSTDLLDELVITWLPPKRGRATGTAVVAQGKTKYTFQINILNARNREKAVKEICKKWPALDTEGGRANIERRFEDLAAQQIETEETQQQQLGSQADLLVEIARKAQLFHSSGGLEAEGFANIPAGDHRENWSVKSKTFRRWLSRQFYRRHKKVASSQAVSDALHVIEGEALFGSAEYEVHVRVARYDDDILLDLGDVRWNTVRISASGWSIGAHPPVRFIRPRGMLDSVVENPVFEEVV